MLRSIIFLFLLIIACSCNYAAKKNKNLESDIKEIVTVYNYRIWQYEDKRDLWDSTVTYIDTKNFNNHKTYVYALNDSTSMYCSYAIENDSLFIDNVHYPNLDTIKLKYNDATVEVIVSEWIDHECVFWNHDYGLVAIYGGTNVVLFDKDVMQGFAKDTFYDYLVNRQKERSRLIFEGLELDEYRW
jgi:hypothetical protein